MIDPARRQFEFMQKKINDAQADADRRLELLRDAPSAEEVGDIEEWFHFYDRWLAKVAKELADA